MILSLKERFRQSIVAMILFIKVMIALHTMIIYIICKKTNWCTFSRSYPTLRTFLLFFRKKEVTFVYPKLLLFLSKPQARYTMLLLDEIQGYRLDDMLARKRDILVFGRMRYNACALMRYKATP